MLAKFISVRLGSHPKTRLERTLITLKKHRVESSNKYHNDSRNPKNNKSTRSPDRPTIQEKRFLEAFREWECVLQKNKPIPEGVLYEHEYYGC
jgi:hypothetical protein